MWQGYSYLRHWWNSCRLWQGAGPSGGPTSISRMGVRLDEGNSQAQCSAVSVMPIKEANFSCGNLVEQFLYLFTSITVETAEINNPSLNTAASDHLTRPDGVRIPPLGLTPIQLLLPILCMCQMSKNRNTPLNRFIKCAKYSIKERASPQSLDAGHTGCLKPSSGCHGHRGWC